MKKSNGFICFIRCLLIIAVLVFPVCAQMVEPTTETFEQTDGYDYSCFSTDARVAYLGTGQLVKNASSVFLYELNTQTLMYAWQPDTQSSPSSFAKIVTAIVAIENSNMDSAVTVTEAALADLPKSAISAKLVDNEVITVKDLLYCMLVGSANDAAAVIAQYISGDQVLFAEKMNEFVERIGCTGSHFTNPHGLHDPQQVTTARDTAKILEYALRNETFRAMFCATEYTVPATNKSTERYLVTGNYLMSSHEVEIYFDDRVIGGRTGVANDTTRCLASVARVGTMELLSVVMGAASVYEESGNKIRSFGGYNETKTLLDIGFAGYGAAQILYDGQALTQFSVAGGDSMVTVCPRANVSSILPENATLADLTFRYSDDVERVSAPISIGDRVCSVEIWFRDLRLAQTDLYAMNSVRDHSVVTLYVQESSGVWLGVFIAVILLAAGVALVFLLRTKKGRRIVNRIRRLRAKNKRRK